MSAVGRLFDIQRLCSRDGPGVRTTVFLQGCSVGCNWCLGSRTGLPPGRTSLLDSAFLGCEYCARALPDELVEVAPDRLADDPPGGELATGGCQGCGNCRWRQGGAIEMVGYEATVPEVLAEILLDRESFAATGGGFTLAGGEPLRQAEFSAELLHAVGNAGIHRCLITGGVGAYRQLKRLAVHAELVYFLLKESDPELHREWTGSELPPIIANLKRLHKAGLPIVLRLPLVEGLNAVPRHFAAVAALVRELPHLLGVELLPVHRLGRLQHELLGLCHPCMRGLKRLDETLADQWLAELQAAGVGQARLVGTRAGH